MANTTSQSYTFDKTLPIDEIVEESYERIGLQNVSGYQLKTAKRSLNILFSNGEIEDFIIGKLQIKVLL